MLIARLLSTCRSSLCQPCQPAQSLGISLPAMHEPNVILFVSIDPGVATVAFERFRAPLAGTSSGFEVASANYVLPSIPNQSERKPPSGQGHKLRIDLARDTMPHHGIAHRLVIGVLDHVAHVVMVASHDVHQTSGGRHAREDRSAQPINTRGATARGGPALPSPDNGEIDTGKVQLPERGNSGREKNRRPAERNRRFVFASAVLTVVLKVVNRCFCAGQKIFSAGRFPPPSPAFRRCRISARCDR